MRKRRLLILAALLLVLLVCFVTWSIFESDGVGNSIAFPVNSEGPTENEFDRNTESNRRADPKSKSRMQDPNDAFALLQQRAPPNAGGSEFSGTVSLGSIFFIRSTAIVTSLDPAVEQSAILSEAVAHVMNDYPEDAIVFDLDSIAEDGTPILLFAKEDYDLTAAVAAQFRQLAAQRAISDTIEMIYKGAEVKRVARRQ